MSLGNGQYAYIGVALDPGKTSEVAVARLKDVEYLKAELKYSVNYTSYKVSNAVARAVKSSDFVMVIYDNKAVSTSKGKRAVPAGDREHVKILPAAQVISENPDAFWLVYRHHMLMSGGDTSDDPVQDIHLITKNKARSGYPVIDDLQHKLNECIKSVDTTKVPARSKVVQKLTGMNARLPDSAKVGFSARDIANLRKADTPEPLWLAPPIPYKMVGQQSSRTEISIDRHLSAEERAFLMPGYTRIGYASLILPPEQIIYTREQPLETKQLIRANGANKKGYGHSAKQFQLQMTISDGATVNGVLLPIIRQFMKTPFVPVENELLNDTYDVQALTLEGLQVATVPGQPNTLDVVIQASEFNWRAYMPAEGDFDSIFCYPIYKLWCEDIHRTDTRPLGWTDDFRYINDLRAGSLDPDPKMNGEVHLYLPSEAHLRKIKEERNHEYTESVMLTQMAKDSDNISRAFQFADIRTRDEVLESNGPTAGSLTPGKDLVVYQSLRVKKKCVENSGSFIYTTNSNGDEFAINGRAVAIRITDRKMAKALLETISISMRTRRWISNSGSSPTSFDNGFFITPPDNGGAVTHARTSGLYSYEMSGVVRDPAWIEKFLNSGPDQAVINQGGPDGYKIDKTLSESYFVIPADSVRDVLTPLQALYKKVKAAADAVKYAATSTVPDMSNEEMIERGLWEEWEIPGMTVEQITVGGENLISSLMPQMQDSPVHQFMGRADCYVVMRGTISDQAGVNALRSTLDQEEYLTRQFGGLYMAHVEGESGGYQGYMLVKNEICQLMGITHVIPMRCTVTSNANYPGTFDFEIVFTQFNTMQQRSEEVRELGEDADWFVNPDTGKVESTTGEKLQTTSDNYFDHIVKAEMFHKKLRTMELYPDLHLPTYQTLQHWIDICLTEDEATRNLYLTDMGINPAAFPWTSADCAVLAKHPLELRSESDGTTKTVAKAFAEPDFYCSPSMPTGESLITGILQTLTGKSNVKNAWNPTGTKGPANMRLRDRLGCSGKLPFRGDIDIKEDQNWSSVNKLYDSVVVPDRSTRQASNSGTAGATAPKAIREELVKAGFKDEHFSAIDKAIDLLGVPAAIAYYLFSLEKGATRQRSGATPSNGDKSYGIGQTQGSAVQSVNNTLGNWERALSTGWVKSAPWGKGYKFKNEDRKDPEKAAFIALAYLKIQHDTVYNRCHKFNGGYDEAKGWAYANVCYVWPSHARDIKSGVTLDQAAAKLPKTTPTAVPNPIKSRYEGGCKAMNGPASPVASLSKSDKQKGVTPKIKEQPAVDKNAAVINNSVTNEDDGTRKTVTAIDGRVTDWFMIGVDYDKTEDPSAYFPMNVYSPSTREIPKAPGQPTTGPTITEVTWYQNTDSGMRKRIMYATTDGGSSWLKDDGSHKYYYVYFNEDDYQRVKNKEMTLKEYCEKYRMSELEQLIPMIRAHQQQTGLKTYTISDMFVREDPNDPYYHQDMFHDMRKYSMFGRLAQAFPAYCILLVDGGRWLRYWRMYDHLFGMTAVESVEIFKTRKSPTDVASVVFSNMYGHLTKQPSVSKQGKVFTWSVPYVIGAIQDSVFTTQDKLAEYLTRWKMHAKSLLLKPGTRMHIRMGYGSNPNNLPVLFNGVISEVTPGGDSVQVVGLGDGIELEKKLQPNDQNADGNMLYKAHSLFGSATTPREIMLCVLAPTKFIELVTVGGYDHNNPHGIEHFGSPTYHFMHKEANEVGMNIFEASSAALQSDAAEAYSNAFLRTIKGLNLIPGYGLLDGDYGRFIFGINLEEATAWDVFTTCRRAIPEYICAVHPFGLRSTVFYGKPHWPLKYDYKDNAIKLYSEKKQVGFAVDASIDDDGIMHITGFDDDEKPAIEDITYWKPYSQMRVISSSLNLITNRITASSEDVYTICQAVGMHNGVLTPDNTYNDWSDKVFLDTDIYPEHQKTLYVKSGLYSTTGQNFVDGLRNLKFADMTGLFTREVGNTYAINALRDTVMDMYKGHVVIIGDTSVKPYDKVYFNDARAEMTGLFQVKEVTHHLSFETGLVTTVAPDLLTSIAEFADQMSWSWMEQFGQRLAGAMALQYMIGTLNAKRLHPLIVLRKLIARLQIAADDKAPWANRALNVANRLQTKVRNTIGDDLDDFSARLYTEKTTEFFDNFVKDFTDSVREIAGIADKAEDSGFVTKHIVSPLTNKLDNIRDVWKIEKEISIVGKSLADALRAKDLVAAGEALSQMKNLKIASVLGKRAGTAAVSAAVSKLCVYLLAVDSLTEWVNRKLAYRQCLILRPLTISGMEFSAGINGHLGCVAGDPEGFWDGVIQSYTNWDYQKRTRRGLYYDHNEDGNMFAHAGMGISALFCVLGGITPVDYRQKSDEAFDDYVFGNSVLTPAQQAARFDAIQKHANKVYNGDIYSGGNPTLVNPVSGSSDDILGFNGAGLSQKLTPPPGHESDYGPDKCNRYAYDLAIANGWTAPKRTPGLNTGASGLNMENLKNGGKHVQYVVHSPSIDKIKPGMIVKFRKDHWAVVTPDYTLNENLNGRIRTDRKLADVMTWHNGIEFAVMPTYKTDKQ